MFTLAVETIESHLIKLAWTYFVRIMRQIAVDLTMMRRQASSVATFGEDFESQ